MKQFKKKKHTTLVRSLMNFTPAACNMASGLGRFSPKLNLSVSLDCQYVLFSIKTPANLILIAGFPPDLCSSPRWTSFWYQNVLANLMNTDSCLSCTPCWVLNESKRGWRLTWVWHQLNIVTLQYQLIFLGSGKGTVHTQKHWGTQFRSVSTNVYAMLTFLAFY